MESKVEITNNPNGINLEYDEKSPITSNKCVIVEADATTGQEHRMCMESGFVTRTELVFNSKECASPDDYSWCVAKVVQITGDDRLKYPIPGKDGEYFTSRLDVENVMSFGGKEFEKALDAFYAIVQESTDEN